MTCSGFPSNFFLSTGSLRKIIRRRTYVHVDKFSWQSYKHSYSTYWFIHLLQFKHFIFLSTTTTINWICMAWKSQNASKIHQWSLKDRCSSCMFSSICFLFFTKIPIFSAVLCPILIFHNSRPGFKILKIHKFWRIPTPVQTEEIKHASKHIYNSCLYQPMTCCEVLFLKTCNQFLWSFA